MKMRATEVARNMMVPATEIAAFMNIAGAIIVFASAGRLDWAHVESGTLTRIYPAPPLVVQVLAPIAGGLGLWMAVTRRTSTGVWTGVGTFVCGAVIAAAAAADLNNLNSFFSPVEHDIRPFDGHPGSGLYLVLVTGILMALTSWFAVVALLARAARGWYAKKRSLA